MEAHWIPTNEFYHRIIAAPDDAAREDLYRELFVRPWQQMMQMVAPMFDADTSDNLAGARAFAWLLPDDLTEIPDALHALEAADAWTLGREALEMGVARFEPYAERIPFDVVEGWLIVADPARSNPIGRGYTGSIDWMQPRFLVQYDTPNEYNLPRLAGAVVHELHHLVRLRIFPWDMTKTSVADYIIYEGTAESFAAALYGEEIVGYYVTEFDDDEFDTARRLIGENLDATGFDVIRGYIFGDTLADSFGFEPVGMPDYGGYTIGYRVVQAYLQRTGTSIEDATFVPADEIVHESGFFT